MRSEYDPLPADWQDFRAQVSEGIIATSSIFKPLYTPLCKLRYVVTQVLTCYTYSSMCKRTCGARVTVGRGSVGRVDTGASSPCWNSFIVFSDSVSYSSILVSVWILGLISWAICNEKCVIPTVYDCLHVDCNSSTWFLLSVMYAVRKRHSIWFLIKQCTCWHLLSPRIDLPRRHHQFDPCCFELMCILSLEWDL